MVSSHNDIVRFGDFVFDPVRLALYYKDDFLKVEKKSLEVLAVLVRNPGELVSTSEIIDEVWRDNLAGIGPVHLAQSISKLRKGFAAHDAAKDYIKNVKGLGYIFDRDVVRQATSVMPAPVTIPADPEPVNTPAKDEQPSDTERSSTEILKDRLAKARRGSSRFVLAGLAMGSLVFISLLAWYMLLQPNEESEIGRIVQESQLYESLVLYRDPKIFKEEDLDKYWTAEADINSNFDRKRIRTAVRSLLEKGLYYGSETKCEQFELQSVEVDVKGEIALVRTLEKWFIAVYRENGGLDRNKYVGPYFVSYVLRKSDGSWLIEKSTTARANLPVPQVGNLDVVTEPKAGQQFFVKLTGQDFIPQSAYVRVVGEGCPEQHPCIVPNGDLLKHGLLTEHSLDKVPLTLGRGEFLLYVHNSENHQSNAVRLVVP